MLTCFEIANYFIWLANDTGYSLSNWKLQKLVYYAQSWHLALKKKPLFNEDFEAWVHGPVIPALYQEYKEFSGHPIEKNIDKEIIKKISSDVIDFLKKIAEKYLAWDAYELANMTHIEKPWKQARGNIPPNQSSRSIIKKDWIEEYYAGRIEEQEKNTTAIKTGQVTSVDRLVEEALPRELAALQRAEIDFALLEMLQDPEYQTEVLKLEIEFAGASWEALQQFEVLTE
ncbi:MAG: SocA family protein [Cyanobacteria bacterium SBLK]|nr:SocA family protein [Cyanobacteria bacterium SBLK]